MNPSAPDITLDPEWLADQADRLLGFEILQNALHARYQPIAPEVLADKIGADKGYSYAIIKNIQRTIDG